MQNIIANIKKIALGLAVMGLAIGFSAFTTNQAAQGTLVGKLGQDEWVIIDPNEEFDTWRCRPTGDVCTGTLKEGAIPNMDGTYNDSEVDYPAEPQNEHFELL